MNHSTSRQTLHLKGMLAVLIVLVIGFPVIYTLKKEGRFTPEPAVTTVSTVKDKNAGTLTFAADYDFDPYSFYDKQHKPSGLDVELATELGNRMHKKVRIVLGNWPQCKQMIQSGKADVLLGLEIFADESKTSTLKTIPVSHDTIKIYGKKKILSAGSLYHKRVGIATGSIITKLFQLNCTYVGYNTNTEILEAVERGEVDYGICHASVASKIIQRDGLHLVPSVTLMESFPALGIRETAPELKAPINRAIKQMSDDGTLTRLHDKWLMNLENRTFKGVFENNFEFYIAYLVIAALVLLATGYLLSQLKLRENNLKMALSYQAVLEEEKRQAEVANKAKSTFLFNMSHDIRTPMNAILGFSDIAIENIDNREQALDALEKARYSSEQMLHIINDVLDMSQIESGKIELHEEVICVPDYVSKMEGMFRISMEQHGLHFEVKDDTSQRYIYGDALRIAQVISNLLSNAMKFTPSGGTVTYHALQLDAPEGCVRYAIHVADTGIGMSASFQNRAFQSFERERSTTESGVQGTGLGLAIAKSLAERMDGSLTFTSEPGKGTEFVFSFQARIAPPPPPPENPAPAADLSGRRILLVEDNALNREIARRILEHAGCLVEEAEDGTAAVEKVSASLPGYFDLVLMDVQMPKMDGYAATRAIRALKDPALAGIPIAAMTANAFEEDRQRALAAGMNAHIAKPLDVPEMLRVMETLLQEKAEKPKN